MNNIVTGFFLLSPPESKYPPRLPRPHLSPPSFSSVENSTLTIVNSETASDQAASCSSNSSFSSVQQLPEFPSIEDFEQSAVIGAKIKGEKLQTLITMYRAHCQRIMDSVNKFSFSEVNSKMYL